MRRRAARRPEQERSARARLPCSHCEAELQNLYVLPQVHRGAGDRFDVCLFCHLKITGTQPGPSSMLD